MPDEDTHNADSGALLWEESRRQIIRQESDVDSLRNRAVALLSVTSLVAGLFGGRVLTHVHRPSVAAALVLFVGSVGAVVVVLAPRWGWEFQQNLEDYFARIREGNLNPQDVSVGLAESVESSRKKNQKQLGTLYWWFLAACILTGLEVVMWGVSVW